MSAHPSRLPVIDGTDFQIVLVGAEAGFNLPELMIAGHGLCWRQIIGAMDQNGMQPIPSAASLIPTASRVTLPSPGKDRKAAISRGC